MSPLLKTPICFDAWWKIVNSSNCIPETDDYCAVSLGLFFFCPFQPVPILLHLSDLELLCLGFV